MKKMLSKSLADNDSLKKRHVADFDKLTAKFDGDREVW